MVWACPREGAAHGRSDGRPAWSPADTRASTAVVSADIPDVVTMAASVCSSSATTAVTCAWFGLPKRVVKSCARRPTVTCAKVCGSSAQNTTVW